MTQKLTLSIAAATFLAALVVLFFLRDVKARLETVETAQAEAAALARQAREQAASERAAQPKTPEAKLDALLAKLEEMEGHDYDYYNDIMNDLHQGKRPITQIKHNVRRIRQMLEAKGGKVPGTLPAVGAPLGGEDIKRLIAEAAEKGVRVAEGRVTVRGFLNLSPNRTMPIEYFVTRYPEAGHETLVHLIGPHDLQDLENTPGAARGMPTALYKGLLAAGFRQGKPLRPDPDSENPDEPNWLMPDGDTVYVYVRYELDGETHLVPATDWVLDPSTGKALPEDAFKFTGSRRTEDPDTGDEIIVAELVGLLASVWPNANALLEVGLPSAVRNDYQYNADRIPKPESLLYLDVIFSKTPLTLADVTGE